VNFSLCPRRKSSLTISVAPTPKAIKPPKPSKEEIKAEKKIIKEAKKLAKLQENFL
jgi:hypothetical protein